MKSVIICAFLYTTAVIANTFIPKPIAPLKDLVEESEFRIISGKPALPGQFPYQVGNYFEVKGQKHFCGGALICDQWVLTAAHCVQGANFFMLYLGSINQASVEGGQPVWIDLSTHAIVHENYSRPTLNNDIALIKLSQPVNFTKNIQPISLRKTPVGENVSVTVSGWGRTASNGGISPLLNYVNLTTISNDECKKVYGLPIVDSTLCCKGSPRESICSGDSGGPLVLKNSQGKYEHVGIVSFTHKNGCDTGNPSGFVRTEKMHSWIESKINGTCTLN